MNFHARNDPVELQAESRRGNALDNFLKELLS
jgi:hypothetical protein